jgi:hypothetical protein
LTLTLDQVCDSLRQKHRASSGCVEHDGSRGGSSLLGTVRRFSTWQLALTSQAATSSGRATPRTVSALLPRPSVRVLVSPSRIRSLAPALDSLEHQGASSRNGRSCGASRGPLRPFHARRRPQSRKRSSRPTALARTRPTTVCGACRSWCVRVRCAPVSVSICLTNAHFVNTGVDNNCTSSGHLVVCEHV